MSITIFQFAKFLLKTECRNWFSHLKNNNFHIKDPSDTSEKIQGKKIKDTLFHGDIYKIQQV